MSGTTGKGKKRDEHDTTSDGDAETHAPPKKSIKKDSDKDSPGDIFVAELSKNRKVSVRIWQGKVWVDIREFYDKDGKQCPGKKGISLSKEQVHLETIITFGLCFVITFQKLTRQSKIKKLCTKWNYKSKYYMCGLV
ncbi:unnamed protein product [Trifolium pratense]|uniref:Uncharacterized protein n=1 Tax=Trifolium pratense TaxID=57577 RepID=A0ACB0J8Y6_TRIPR|nr:unnamed protein product [Trifolium pratense]